MRAPRVLEDDRLYRLEIVQWRSDLKGREWAVVTIHNLRGRLPARQDYFASQEDALSYYLKIVVETPRLSLGSRPPDPIPSLEQYSAWLKYENLYDPVLNPEAKVLN